MTDLNVDQLAKLEPREFAQLIKSTSDADLAAALHGEQRGPILDTIFGKMPGLFRPDRAGTTQTVIHWTITEGPDGGTDTYELVIADGACTLSPAPEHDPKLAITVGPVNFLKLVAGSGNPTMMFMTGKLKAKGDLALAANIASLFDIPKA